MEPVSTFKEASRLLRKGGIFLSVDCDFPPVINVEAEKLYTQFVDGSEIYGTFLFIYFANILGFFLRYLFLAQTFRLSEPNLARFAFFRRCIYLWVNRKFQRKLGLYLKIGQKSHCKMVSESLKV